MLVHHSYMCTCANDVDFTVLSAFLCSLHLYFSFCNFVCHHPVCVQSSFVGAIAIGDLIRSTLGPKGMVSVVTSLAVCS